MGSALNRKSPLPLLVADRLIPCWEFFTVTCAPGIAAPLGSVTVPVMEAVSCANAAEATMRETANRNSQRSGALFISTPDDSRMFCEHLTEKLNMYALEHSLLQSQIELGAS